MPLAFYISARPGDKAARLCLRTLTLPHRLPSGSPLPSTLPPRLHRYYGPLRLPTRPHSQGNVGMARILRAGSPVLRKSLFPTCRLHFPGGGQPIMSRLKIAYLGAFPTLEEGGPEQHSLGDFPEFTRVTILWFRAQQNWASLRRATLEPVAQTNRPCSHRGEPKIPQIRLSLARH